MSNKALELDEAEQNKSLMRLKEEVNSCKALIEGHSPKYCFIDGSIIPQYQDKPRKDSKITDNYHGIIHEFESSFPRLFPSKPFKAFPKDFKFEVLPKVQKPFLQFWGERKYIGVSLQELNPELAEYFGVEEGTGLLITKITKDSPAAEAGLKVGDVILSADGKKVNKADKLSNMIHEKEKGEVVKLQIIRDKKKRTIEVRVEENEEEGVKFSWKRSKQNFEKTERILKEYQKKADAKYKSAEKMYQKLKSKRGTKEYDWWFLRYIPADHDSREVAFEVESYNKTYPARLEAKRALYDPERKKILI